MKTRKLRCLIQKERINGPKRSLSIFSFVVLEMKMFLILLKIFYILLSLYTRVRLYSKFINIKSM